MTKAFIRPPIGDVNRLAVSRLADIELVHLERVVAYLSQHRDAIFDKPLDFVYWTKRLDYVEVSFSLVPAQHQKLAALRRTLNEMTVRSSTSKLRGSR